MSFRRQRVFGKLREAFGCEAPAQAAVSCAEYVAACHANGTYQDAMDWDI
jgi:hypothetical protein